MKISTDRILTTHTGSLPRPKSLSISFSIGKRELPSTRSVRNRDRESSRGRGRSAD